MLKQASLVLLAVLFTSQVYGETWYIRADGGTRHSARMPSGQCDGKKDAPYSGSGTNQHCAFNDWRALYDDLNYGEANRWVIAGGDTVILDNKKPWRVGFDQGLIPGDKWCRDGAGAFGCFNPVIPSGSEANHTKILGRNHGACNKGFAADPSKMSQLFGGYGVYAVLNLQGAQYVDVECIEITRHSQCVRHGDPMYPSNCSSSFPLDDYDSEGIVTDQKTHDLWLKDMWIHGHTDRGIIGPIGGTVTALRTTISYNGMAGWDFDDGKSTPLVHAIWNLIYSTIEWNGCNQEYPASHIYPAISCYGQSNGGYGDGVGTPAGTGMTANVDHSTFRYNTQDGLDLGHVDTGGPYELNVNSSTFYGNNGGQFKWGANLTKAVITNNLVLSNCMRMSAKIDGAPDSFNAHLGDFCRAQDAISFNFIHGGSALIANNTIVSYSPTTFDIDCWDKNCGDSVLIFKNNIVLGFDNPATHANGGQVGGPGIFYFQNKIGNVTKTNNVYYGLRGMDCAARSGERCIDPRFIGEPSHIITKEQVLDHFNFHLANGSPAEHLGASLNDRGTEF